MTRRLIGESAGHHVVASGRRRVVYLRHAASGADSDECLVGLEKALCCTANPYQPELIVVEVGADSARGGRRAVEEILLYSPDAVLCATVGLADGVRAGFTLIGVDTDRDVDVSSLVANAA